MPGAGMVSSPVSRLDMAKDDIDMTPIRIPNPLDSNKIQDCENRREYTRSAYRKREGILGRCASKTICKMVHTLCKRIHEDAAGD
jgi:hypothetical protein